jgi:hypothetical protein
VVTSETSNPVTLPVQSLRDVCDQIGRVFEPDRQPDRGVEHADFLPDVSGNALRGGFVCCDYRDRQLVGLRLGSQLLIFRQDAPVISRHSADLAAEPCRASGLVR